MPRDIYEGEGGGEWLATWWGTQRGLSPSDSLWYLYPWLKGREELEVILEVLIKYLK